MKNQFLLSLSLSVFVLAACQSVPAAYRAGTSVSVSEGAQKLVVLNFSDDRPDTEKRGQGAGLMNKSTKDAMYKDSVAEAITWAMIDELRTAQVDAAPGLDGEYKLSGSVKSYRTKLLRSPGGFLPYIKYIAWPFAKDEIASSVSIEMTLWGPGGEMWKKQYDVAADTKAWVGPFGLSSTARSWDRPGLVKYLRAALKEALPQAAAEVAARLKEK